MGASDKTKLSLAMRSGNRCAFQGCQENLTLEAGENSDIANVGEAAHIAGEKDTAARYDPNMSDEQRNHYDNLIYLCRKHHSQIDKQAKDFPVALLLEWKAKHIKIVYESMLDGLALVGSSELEKVVSTFFSTEPTGSDSDFTVLTPEEKIKKNGLTSSSRIVLQSGLALASEVKEIIQMIAKEDADFPERLKSGFLSKYHEHRSKGITGDHLFETMCYFAQQGFKEQHYKVAGLAVLSYLFESCEVFDK